MYDYIALPCSQGYHKGTRQVYSYCQIYSILVLDSDHYHTCISKRVWIGGGMRTEGCKRRNR